MLLMRSTLSRLAKEKGPSSPRDWCLKESPKGATGSHKGRNVENWFIGVLKTRNQRHTSGICKDVSTDTSWFHDGWSHEEWNDGWSLDEWHEGCGHNV